MQSHSCRKCLLALSCPFVFLSTHISMQLPQNAIQWNFVWENFMKSLKKIHTGLKAGIKSGTLREDLSTFNCSSNINCHKITIKALSSRELVLGYYDSRVKLSQCYALHTLPILFMQIIISHMASIFSGQISVWMTTELWYQTASLLSSLMKLYWKAVGAHGGVVVKALCYKPAGHGFNSWWCHWNFSVT